MQNENKFQSKLIEELKAQYPDALIIKTDPHRYQGLPDILILEKNKWAMLECKKQKNASHRPNQEFYVNKANDMSFARFIYPENKGEVLNELQRALQP